MRDAGAMDAKVVEAVGAVAFPSCKLGGMGGLTVEVGSAAIVDADVGWTVVGVSFPSLKTGGTKESPVEVEMSSGDDGLTTGERAFPSSKGCAKGSAADEGSRHEAKWSLQGMMSLR